MIFEFSSWSLLGPILDQFWLHFGSQNPTKSAPRELQSRSKKWSKNLLSLGSIFKWFLNFLHDRSWERFWINFGSILALKIRPNRPQEVFKVDQKSDRKTCWVWDRFLNDFWSFLGQNGGRLSRRSNLKNLKNPSLGLKMWLKPPGRVPRHSKYSKILQKWREILYFFREKVISANCYCCHF